MEDIELDVGGTKIKGVWIAILFSFASTIGGGIWAASEFFSRLDAQEEAVQDASNTATLLDERFNDLKNDQMVSLRADTKESLADFSGRVKVIEDKLQLVNVDELQGKLSELGTNLKTIMDQQERLLEISDRVVEVEKLVTEMKTTVRKAEIATKDAEAIQEKLDRMQREVDDLWEAMDFMSGGG